jgi:hypothetical protein
VLAVFVNGPVYHKGSKRLSGESGMKPDSAAAAQGAFHDSEGKRKEYEGEVCHFPREARSLVPVSSSLSNRIEAWCKARGDCRWIVPEREMAHFPDLEARPA